MNGSPRRRSGLAALVAAAAAVVLVGSACGSGPSSTRLASIGAGLSGPAGVHASRYAQAAPHVAALAFDGSGRLWVATADYSDSGADALYVVDRAGSAPVPVVTGLHTPLGLLWLDDTLFVASKERVDAYQGFDGTSFASSHTVVALPAGVGEVNGLVHAPDGRILLGISAPCDHCTPSSEMSGSIVSFQPNGSAVAVFARRIRAPIGLAFVPGTSDLLVTMNQRDDLGARTPGDWLAAVREGDAFGFPDCYGQGGAACQGVPSPVAVLDRHAAVAGVVVARGGPAGDGLVALVAEWSTGKVLRVELHRTTVGYRGTVTPFLTGVRNPVALALDGDAVVVGDWTTGDLYRLTRG